MRAGDSQKSTALPSSRVLVSIPSVRRNGDIYIDVNTCCLSLTCQYRTQNKYLTIINTYCQLQSLYSNLLESMLMPRKGTVTRCNFVACNKVAPYYY